VGKCNRAKLPLTRAFFPSSFPIPFPAMPKAEQTTGRPYFFFSPRAVRLPRRLPSRARIVGPHRFFFFFFFPLLFFSLGRLRRRSSGQVDPEAVGRHVPMLSSFFFSFSLPYGSAIDRSR